MLAEISSSGGAILHAVFLGVKIMALLNVAEVLNCTSLRT